MVTDLECPQWDVLMPQLARCFSHFLNRAFAVAGGGVHVQIAFDDLRQA